MCKEKSKITRIRKTNNLKFRKTIIHQIRTTCECKLCKKFKNYNHEKKKNHTEEEVIEEGYSIGYIKTYGKLFEKFHAYRRNAMSNLRERRFMMIERFI